HQRDREWVHAPALVPLPQPGGLVLGALTGIQESSVAYLFLTRGIGCYAFPDTVLTPGGLRPPSESGLADNGSNYLQVFANLQGHLPAWQHLREMAAAMRRLKPSLRSLDLELPSQGRVVVGHGQGEGVVVFDLSQESEGFRRLLACLLALY